MGEQLTYVLRKQGGGRKDAAYLVIVDRVVNADDPGDVFYVVDKKWGKWSTYLQYGNLQTQNSYSGTEAVRARLAVAQILNIRAARNYERQRSLEHYPDWSHGWPGAPYFKKAASKTINTTNTLSLPVDVGEIVVPKAFQPQDSQPTPAQEIKLTTNTRRRRRRGHRGRIEVD